MTLIHTICLFISGYIASRLLVRLKWHIKIVSHLMGRFRGKPEMILCSIMVGCAFLSLILPNALTVLAVIPVIKLLTGQSQDELSNRPPEDKPVSNSTVTACVLAVIYGANIGGIGSLIGSPANLYLIFALEVMDTPGRSAVNFVSWFIFGFPLMLLLLIVASGLLVAFTPKKVKKELSNLTPGSMSQSRDNKTQPEISSKLRIFGVFAFLTIITLHAAILISTSSDFSEPVMVLSLATRRYSVFYADIIAAAVTLLTTTVVMTVRFKTSTPPRPGSHSPPAPSSRPTTETYERLLPLNQITGHIPWRGLLAIVLALAVVFGASVLGGRQMLHSAAKMLTNVEQPSVLVVFSFVMITLFATEVLSNTTTATILFPAAALMSVEAGLAPIPPTIAISMASTCAFMTPIATPVNALAFGAVKGVKVSRMLYIGLLLNIASGIIITFWASFVLSHILNLFS